MLQVFMQSTSLFKSMQTLGESKRFPLVSGFTGFTYLVVVD
jgi:hypothetical protein